MLLPALAVAGEARCPKSHTGFRLKTATLYDGPMSEHADLMPDGVKQRKGSTRSEWNVAYIFKAGRRLFVECDYGPRAKPIVIKPNVHVRACFFDQSRHGARAALSCR